MRVGRAHGLDFARSWPDLLQRPEAKELVALPERIETDLWHLQARPVECEHVPGRCVGVHALKMPGEQRLYPIIAKVGGFDHWHGRQRIAARRFTCIHLNTERASNKKAVRLPSGAAALILS